MYELVKQSQIWTTDDNYRHRLRLFVNSSPMLKDAPYEVHMVTDNGNRLTTKVVADSWNKKRAELLIDKLFEARNVPNHVLSPFTDQPFHMFELPNYPKRDDLTKEQFLLLNLLKRYQIVVFSLIKPFVANDDSSKERVLETSLVDSFGLRKMFSYQIPEQLVTAVEQLVEKRIITTRKLDDGSLLYRVACIPRISRL